MLLTQYSNKLLSHREFSRWKQMLHPEMQTGIGKTIRICTSLQMLARHSGI